MNFLKKLFNRKTKVDKNEQKKECWYNNAHEEGEVVKNATAPEFAGSTNGYEAHLTESGVRR